MVEVGARKGVPSFLPASPILDDAETIEDLRIPPSNHLEVLKRDRKEQHSIRINRQYRICFRWTEGGVRDAEIVDYHP